MCLKEVIVQYFVENIFLKAMQYTFVSLVHGQGLFFSITRGTKVYFIAKKTLFFTKILKYNYL